MSSKKYIPPHLRRSSANKPPPAYTNDSFVDERNKNRYRQSVQRPYRRTIQNNNNHRRCNNANFNRFSRQRFDNTATLQEVRNTIDPKQMEMIDLDKYIMDSKKQRKLEIEIVSEYIDPNAAQLIIEFCNDDMILIPNTFNRKEFLKYWFIVRKGEMVNEYRNYHRVDLYANYLQLIRRGSIASIKGYKPSKSAKLRLECKWKYHDPRDWMMLSLQSSGYRHPQQKWAKYGEVAHEGNRVTVTNGKSPLLSIHSIDEEFTYTENDYISSISLNKEVSMIITDDGQEFKVEVECGQDSTDDKIVHSFMTDSIDTPQGFNRICVFNRELEGNVCDVTFLELSVVPSSVRR